METSTTTVYRACDCNHRQRPLLMLFELIVSTSVGNVAVPLQKLPSFAIHP
jgi:hypothetical protein